MSRPLTEEQFEALGKWIVSAAMLVSYRHNHAGPAIIEAAEELVKHRSEIARRALVSDTRGDGE